jgi:competence protein ComEC
MQYKTIIIVILILLSIRFFFYYSSQKKLLEGNLRITGVVNSEALFFERQQRIEIEGYKIYLPVYPGVSYRDTVVVEGEASDGVIKKGILVENKESQNLLHVFRRNLLHFYKKVLPTDSAALVAGTTIGSKQLLTQSFWEQLVATGTVHVVVASGMNVTVISKFLLDLLLQFFPRRKALPFAMVGIWLYATIAGLGAPIIRAALMGSLTFLAQETGKLSTSLWTLFLTSIGMLFWKPEWIVDLSFLLSFAATISIVLLQKPIEKKLQRVPSLIRSDFTTSLAASIGTAPIIVWSFGRFNPLSPCINALVLWTIVPITLIGGVGGIVGLILEPAGKLLLYLIYPLTWWFIWIVSIFS